MNVAGGTSLEGWLASGAAGLVLVALAQANTG
jgi:hypothetical protein